MAFAGCTRRNRSFPGGQLLRNAAEAYGRALTPEEYWWLGVGLAAATLAELGGREYAARRIQQLLGRLGGPGDPEEWFEQFHNELAALDAEGLLWPLYQRDERGKMARTDAVVAAGFDADAGSGWRSPTSAIARAVRGAAGGDPHAGRGHRGPHRGRPRGGSTCRAV